MSAPVPTDTHAEKKSATFTFSDTPTDLIADHVATVFTDRQYRLETGSPTEGTYGTGSDVLRVFLGAFAKRYKFSVAITPNGQETECTLAKAMSGAMGGVIGARKMTKEFEALVEVFSGQPD